MKKPFSIEQVLSIVGGKLLCNIGGIYEILNHMTQDTIYTHQIPRACDECNPWLLRWFPQLADYDDSSVTPENVKEWVRAMVKKYGETLEVDSIPRDDHEIIDPIKEAEKMFGKHHVITVDPDVGDPDGSQ